MISTIIVLSHFWIRLRLTIRKELNERPDGLFLFLNHSAARPALGEMKSSLMEEAPPIPSEEPTTGQKFNEKLPILLCGNSSVEFEAVKIAMCFPSHFPSLLCSNCPNVLVYSSLIFQPGMLMAIKQELLRQRVCFN